MGSRDPLLLRERIDELNEVLPADSGGDGTASVTLGGSDTSALTKMMTRLKSDAGSNPVTGADLGAGPGAGRTTNGDKGTAKSIHAATREAEMTAKAERMETSDAH